MPDTSGVLIVEDDEDDLFLTQRVVRRHFLGRILHVESGRAAIEYLSGTGPYADRVAYPWPALMFLDLKMHDGSGHDVLEWVKQQGAGANPRIFVLTGSNEFSDRERVQRSGVAAGYIVKPLLADHFAEILGPTAQP